MKRIIWVSLLLAMAGVLLPLVFSGGNDPATVDPQSLEPAPSPSPIISAEPSFDYTDESFRFKVLIGDEVKEMSMAEYLPCAVAAEMPTTFETEALKAQAVAARTYVIYCTGHENPKHSQADVCTSSGCCLAYLDETALRSNWGDSFNEKLSIVKAAVQETSGMLLTYEDTPILATFHSSSSGATEKGSELWGDVPYLASVKSPETAEDVPNYITTVEVSVDNFRDSVLLLHPEAVFVEDAGSWLGERELDESGRVRSVAVCGTKLSGSEMRKLFSLRSTAFNVDYDGSAFVFTVTGYGHGLGMSQYGANVMAKGGFTYEEILLHYYPGSELEK